MALVLSVLVLSVIVSFLSRLLNPLTILRTGKKRKKRALTREASEPIDPQDDPETAPRRPSLGSALAAYTLLCAAGTLLLVAILQHHQYSSLSLTIRGVADELGGLIDVVEARGRNLRQALTSLNDVLLQSYLDVLIHEGHDAAHDYSRQLELAQAATDAIDLNKPHFDSIVTDLLHVHGLLMSERVPVRRDILKTRGWVHAEVLELLQGMEKDTMDLVRMLREGMEQLEAAVLRARKTQPQMAAEAREIQSVVEKSIRDALSGDDVISLLPLFELSDLEIFTRTLREDTSFRMKKVATTITQMGHHNLCVGIAAVFAALFPLFVGRYRGSLVGILSLVVLTLLVAYQLLFRQDLSDFQQEISAACAALGEGSRHSSWSLAILDMEIGGDEVGAFLAACEDGAPLSVALREALGLDTHFGGALILDEDQMGLAFDVDNVLYVPYEIETLGESLAELQAAAIKDIFSSGEIHDLVADYRHNADLCRIEATLPFPHRWREALTLSTALLDRTIKNEAALDHLQRVERGEEWTRYLASLNEVLGSIQGMSHLLVDISRRLRGACEAQRTAVDRFADTDSNAATMSRIRMVAVAEKARTLLAPTFDSSFIVRPARKCLKHICVQSQEDLELVNVMSQLMLGGLVVALVATAILSKALYLLCKIVRMLAVPV